MRKSKLFRLLTTFLLIGLSFSIQAQASEVDDAKKELKIETNLPNVG